MLYHWGEQRVSFCQLKHPNRGGNAAVRELHEFIAVDKDQPFLAYPRDKGIEASFLFVRIKCSLVRVLNKRRVGVL